MLDKDTGAPRWTAVGEDIRALFDPRRATGRNNNARFPQKGNLKRLSLIAINVSHWARLSADQKIQTVMHGGGRIPTRACVYVRCPDIVHPHQELNAYTVGKLGYYVTFKGKLSEKERGGRNTKLLAGSTAFTLYISNFPIPTTPNVK